MLNQRAAIIGVFGRKGFKLLPNDFNHIKNVKKTTLNPAFESVIGRGYGVVFQGGVLKRDEER